MDLPVTEAFLIHGNGMNFHSRGLAGIGNKPGVFFGENRRSGLQKTVSDQDHGLYQTGGQKDTAFGDVDVPVMSQALGSSCRRPRPCRAEVGNAWWLLCQASPKAIGASQARLRE